MTDARCRRADALAALLALPEADVDTDVLARLLDLDPDELTHLLTELDAPQSRTFGPRCGARLGSAPQPHD